MTDPNIQCKQLPKIQYCEGDNFGEPYNTFATNGRFHVKTKHLKISSVSTDIFQYFDARIVRIDGLVGIILNHTGNLILLRQCTRQFQLFVKKKKRLYSLLINALRD